MTQIALIGATASGKSALALELAQKYDAYILSLDSLSVYKEIDITSAKPSRDELKMVRHFGVDEIYPSEHFSAALFAKLYERAKQEATKDSKNLIIVGGTGFYLKALIDGLSEEPKYSDVSRERARKEMADLDGSYRLLQEIDPHYAGKISNSDRYRIEKGLLLFYESGLAPSAYFEAHKKDGLKNDIPIFEIAIERDILREKIKLRTKKMLDDGLIDEACYLEKKYTREPNCMGAIGIKEVLSYLDGRVKKVELESLISTHTAQLAKRQETFNKTQFLGTIRDDVVSLKNKIERLLEA